MLYLYFKAEAGDVYNPWGKPGAGAPIRDVTGNVMADYKVRKVCVKTSKLFQLQCSGTNDVKMEPCKRLLLHENMIGILTCK